MTNRAAKRFRARIMHSLSPEKVEDIRDGVLEVDDSGRIVSFGWADPMSNAQVQEFPSRLIIPGLVDVHSHIPQLDARGKHGSTLLAWLDRYILPAEMAFAEPRVVDDVAVRFFKKLILNGTTTAGLYSTVHAEATNRCFEIAQAAGVRCFIGKVMMDRNAPAGLLETTADSLGQSEALCAKWHGAGNGRLRYAFTPRFAPTCSFELLKDAAELARSAGAYLQSHIAETLDENDRVKELFPGHRDYVSLFEDAGCLGPRTILAHAIHLSDDEYRRLAASDTKIAHCPTSNFFLKSGRMSVRRVEGAGCAYGFGTDVGAGTSMSIFTEMRHADYAQDEHSIPPAKALWLATMGGAAVMSMDSEIGNFAPGKFADFCVLDISGIDPVYRLDALDTDELLSLLMYRGDSQMIESTYVAGERLDVDAISRAFS